MKHLIFILLTVLLVVQTGGCVAENRSDVKDEVIFPVSSNEAKGSQVISLDEAGFAEKVFDFKNSKQWSYKGDRPAIIDFYATWCGPCKRLAPMLVEIQKEYGEKIQIYKVDAEKNRELAAAFGVTAYPTMLFIPMGADPAGAKGLLPKEEIERIIETFLKVTK